MGSNTQTLDWPLDHYLDVVKVAVSQARFNDRPLQSSPKYREGHALPYSGFTLMTPSSDLDDLSAPLYRVIESAQTHFTRTFSPHLIPVPPQSFHVTGADLISGDAFTSQLYGASIDTYRMRLIEALKLTLKSSSLGSKSGSQVTSLWNFRGFSLFESALVALFTPMYDQTYTALVQQRAHLYHSPYLTQLGVVSPRPLMLHITLAYFTESLALDLKAQELLTTEVLRYQRDNFYLSSSNKGEPHHSWCDDQRLMLTLTSFYLHFFTDMQSYLPTQPQVCFNI